MNTVLKENLQTIFSQTTPRYSKRLGLISTVWILLIAWCHTKQLFASNRCKFYFVVRTHQRKPLKIRSHVLFEGYISYCLKKVLHMLGKDNYLFNMLIIVKRMLENNKIRKRRPILVVLCGGDGGGWRGVMVEVIEPQQPRHRSNRSNGSNRTSPGGGEEVTVCSANASFRGKSSLLRTKTKSRLIDPPEADQRSGRLSKSGLLNKGGSEIDEDDEDLSDEYKQLRYSKWTLPQLFSFMLILAALTCTLTILFCR
ncbi:hypothetical protein Hdeb2414_s0013g00416291 [Helianthus debilis subsp. tardiflorus]